MRLCELANHDECEMLLIDEKPLVTCTMLSQPVPGPCVVTSRHTPLTIPPS